MAGRTPYPQEMKERAVRMVGEVRGNYGNEYTAIKAVAARLGIGSPETVRKWLRRAQVDAGERPGLTSEEKAEIKALKQEVSELRRANEILKAASAFSRPNRLATAVLVMFISKHKDAFGVEPVCRVLTGSGWQIAPGTYYAAVRRLPPARAVRDAQILAGIRQMRAEYEEVYGARKTWLELNRRGIPVARCTVERVMREHGLRGVRRGRMIRTTIPGKGPGHERAADLIGRDFTAPALDRRWVADFTHVATLAGTVNAAFVVDIFSRMFTGPGGGPAQARQSWCWTPWTWHCGTVTTAGTGSCGADPSFRRGVAVHLHRVHRPPWPCQPRLAPLFSFDLAPHSVAPGWEFSFDLAPPAGWLRRVRSWRRDCCRLVRHAGGPGGMPSSAWRSARLSWPVTSPRASMRAGRV